MFTCTYQLTFYELKQVAWPNPNHSGRSRGGKEGMDEFWTSKSIRKMKVRNSPGGPVVEPTCQCRGLGFDPWSGKMTPAAGQRSPAPQLLSPRALVTVPGNEMPAGQLSPCTSAPEPMRPRDRAQQRDASALQLSALAQQHRPRAAGNKNK